jgi:hypothetical protein
VAAQTKQWFVRLHLMQVIFIVREKEMTYGKWELVQRQPDWLQLEFVLLEHALKNCLLMTVTQLLLQSIFQFIYTSTYNDV